MRLTGEHGQGSRGSWRSGHDPISLYMCMHCSKFKTHLCITSLWCELTFLTIKCKRHCVNLQSTTLTKDKNNVSKRTRQLARALKTSKGEQGACSQLISGSVRRPSLVTNGRKKVQFMPMCLVNYFTKIWKNWSRGESESKESLGPKVFNVFLHPHSLF